MSKTETTSTNAEARQKFMTRRGKALALIGLTLDPSLLYLIDNEDDPCKVWETLEGQFQRKTWANKLQLRKKLITLMLKEGGSVNDHIKEITQTFESLSIMDAPVGQSCLETQSESVPKWSLVTERLLHQEAKMKEKEAQYGEVKKAFLASSQQKRRKPESTFKFHFCRKIGHFERECRKFLATQGKGKQSANPMESKQTGDHVLVTTHALYLL